MARGVVAAPIDAVLAVLVDIESAGEWLVMCRESALIEARTLGHSISYNRTASPTAWVQDRDAVVQAETHMQPGHRSVRYAFQRTEHTLRPPVPGVVRVPALEGFWHLTQVDARRTSVIYQVRADAGGSLPPWLANFGARDVPYRSLRALQQQLGRRPLPQQLRAVRQNLDWRGFGLTGPS